MNSVLEPLEELVEKIHRKLWASYTRKMDEQRTLALFASASGVTSSGGNLDLALYANTTGKHLVIGRVVLLATGLTPQTVSTTGYLYLYSGRGNGSDPPLSNVFDFLPNASGGQVLPNVAEYSGHNALRLRQNETLSLYLNGGPASTQIYGAVYGFLEPTSSDYDL